MKNENQKLIARAPWFQSFHFLIFCFMILVGHFLAHQSYSNTEELIISIDSGGQPYLLVRQNNDPQSTRAPGIYGRGSDGEWELIHGGAFLSPALAGGVPLQLDHLSGFTGRFETMSVADGRVVLFHALSRPLHPESVAIFGENHFKVKDPRTLADVPIPMISSMDQVTLYDTVIDSHSSNPTQIILVSIRTPGTQASTGKPNGLTFAVALKINENQRHPDFVPAYSPVLLDETFHAQSTELNGLVIKAQGSYPNLLVSQLLIKYYGNPISQEPHLAAEWRRTLLSDPDSMQNDHSLPSINALTGTLSLPVLPGILLSRQADAHNIAYFWDPIRNTGGIYSRANLSHEGFQEASPLVADIPTVLPDVSSGEESEYFVRHVSMQLDTQALSNPQTVTFVLTRRGELYAITATAPSDRVHSIILTPTNSIIRNRHLKNLTIRVIPYSNIVLVSWFSHDASHEAGLTSVYQIDWSNNSLRITNAATLTRSFYSETELAQRIIRLPESGQYFFDGFTPISESAENYREQHRLTAPHIDLLATLRRGLSPQGPLETCPHPIRDRRITENVHVLEYEHTSNSTSSRTGIYSVGEKGELSLLQLGTPHQTRLSPESSGIIDVFNRSFATRDPVRTILSIVNTQQPNEARTASQINTPLTPAQKKNYRISLIFSIGASDKNATHVASSLGSPDGFDPQDILYIDVIPDIVFEKPATENAIKTRPFVPIAIVVGFKNGPTKLFYMRVRRGTSDRTPVVDGLTERILDAHFIGAQEARNRLAISSENDLTIINTPHLDPSDPNYEIMRLDGARLLINQAGRGLLVRALDAEAPVSAGRYSTWRHSASNPTTRELDTRLRGMSEYSTDIFVRFRELLDELANPEKPARRVVLIVPPELMSFAKNYPLALRVRGVNRSNFWSERNPRFDLQEINEPKVIDQEAAITNLSLLRDAGEHGNIRNVFMSPMDTISNIGRPTYSDRGGHASGGSQAGFRVRERRLGSVSGTNSGPGLASQLIDSTGAPGETNSGDTIDDFPTFLYLLATEGRTLDLKTFREHRANPVFSTLLIGTEDQWNFLLNQSSLENRYGLADRFEIVRLDSPTRESRIDYAVRILSSPEVRAMGYRYDISELLDATRGAHLNEQQRIHELASYLVNRTENLATENGLDVFTSFVRTLNVLAYALTHDDNLRQRAVINRQTIGRILPKVFSTPISLDSLSDDDPLRILYGNINQNTPGNRRRPRGEEATLRWVQAGYYGDPKIKTRVIGTILSQLEAGESKPVPSSILLYGDTGTGKTSLITTLVEGVLGLKYYSFTGNAEVNRRAEAFFAPLRMVLDDTGTDRSANSNNQGTPPTRPTGSVTLSEFLNHLDRFLGLPRGDRGYLIFDDFHVAPPAVRERILARLRGILDSSTTTALNSDNARIEIRTRNLVIFITMNLTEDQTQLAKFTKKDQTLTNEQRILATLSTQNQALDSSFLARFGLVLNVDTFSSTEAKGPQLAHTVARAMRSIFQNQGRLGFVSRRVLDRVASTFVNMDARNFLSVATSAVARGVAEYGSRSGVFVVRPREEFLQSSSVDSSVGSSGSAQKAALETFIQENTETVPVTSTGLSRDFSAQLELLKLLTNNVRLRAFEFLLTAISNEAQRSLPSEAQANFLGPFAQALARHLTDVPELPFSEMTLLDSAFGATSHSDKTLLHRQLELELSRQRVRQSALPGFGTARSVNLLDAIRMNQPIVESRTRSQIALSLVEDLGTPLEDLVKALFFIDDFSALPDSIQWLENLPPSDPHLLQISTHPEQAFSRIIQRFFLEIQSTPPVNRSLMDHPEASMTTYDVARLAIAAFDRALARLPWSPLFSFLNRSLTAASENLSVGQLPGVQRFLFSGRLSPLTLRDPGMIRMLLENVPYFQNPKEPEQNARFLRSCGLFLETTQARSPQRNEP